MVDFANARRAMVDSQVSTSGVTEPRLLRAMGSVPREAFLPPHRQPLAYLDDHHALGNGRFLSAPATFARLVQLAGITAGDIVLDVGCGTGYSAAILASLGQRVVGVEIEPALAETARENLSDLGVGNTEILSDHSTLSPGSFDAIVVEGALDAAPQELLPLLRKNGRLVALIRNGRVGIATRIVASGGTFNIESHFNATLPPLQTAVKAEEFVF